MTATARIISARAALDEPADTKRRKAFGLAVAARRKSLKLKQDGLAIAMGVSVAHICNMEKGLNWPSIPAYEKLCRALQVGAPPLMK